MERYRDRIRVLAPHYLAMLALIFLALIGIETLLPELSRVGRWLVVAIVAIGYVVVLRATDRAPEPWR